MTSVIVGRTGPFAGQSVVLGSAPLRFGRKSDNDVIIVSVSASRLHTEIVEEDGAFVLHDRSRNGTFVNDQRVTRHVLVPGDSIRIGDETFLFETQEAVETVMDLSQLDLPRANASANPGELRVTVSGGGPVGLAFALLLENALPGKAAITVYDGRWVRNGSTVVWKDETQGNVRRMQVVTAQSRQYLALTDEMQSALFDGDGFSEMWPLGPDSVEGRPPRNIRIAYIEDKLLELANAKSAIRLVPKRFDPSEQQNRLSQEHVLVIAEGGGSRTREHFKDRFGAADSSIYSLDGEHLQDLVLGLRVKSQLSDPMSVLLTVAQNRFLLNSLRGEGFLNMRLTREEAGAVIGIDPVRQVFEECVAARPCLMSRHEDNEFVCPTHGTLFLPALLRSSPLWKRIQEGLRLFGVAADDLTAITSFRLDMVQRPRFTAQLSRPTSTSPGTYGFLLGDAANAIHFWPGRGLNSGLASAVSLARSLSRVWQGRPLRDADFIRHEAAMSMLQYRHKSRAWNAMVTTDERGVTRAIKDIIADSMEGDRAVAGPGAEQSDLDLLLDRMRAIRERLAPRLPGMPSDEELRSHLSTLAPSTLRSLQESGAWDTLIVGGEEADIDIFYQSDAPVFVGRPIDPRVPGQPAGPRQPGVLDPA
ncbi:2-polyprenyl-6-methoxyphenol hydroxylase-like FAD-dependent oxidoreductase [Streptomyces umbrinus]|uniref:2-polyprenyl-6-methoxyphenol hydroxylase-like FAD-dependent oxidoreductase n=1 Tax=Streptomyces umbrinus TaxID=67370 RepID=A0ABU0T8F7_9ACTN|nr:FHA domain-containing protein [Streptomyces umbrinus]MDQ1032099.1 2-polyprenyl-6-methoxyphenol hydroxylase-like FAD-dependent oxidoreductase [Streptomyces umbrinus]